MTIRSELLIEPDDEKALQIAVALLGPLSASIEATSNFFFYKSGVFFDPACGRSTDLASKTINHAVLLVGYETDPAGGGTIG